MNQEAYTYKSLLKKVYDVICANDYIYFCYHSDLYFLIHADDIFWSKYHKLTSAQRKYIINKVSAYGSYWTNNIFRCPAQWKRLNNNIRCVTKALILASSTIKHIDNYKERERYKELLLCTTKHNYSRINNLVYSNITNFD